MGTSTDAYLWFGVKAEANEDDGEEGLPLRVREKLVELGHIADVDDEDGESTEAVDEILEPLGVELVRTCSYDYPMYALGIASTVSRAWRGQFVEIKNVDVDPEWLPQLMKAAEAIGWPVGDAGWFLASMWG